MFVPSTSGFLRAIYMSNPSIQNRKYCFFVLRRQHRVLNPPPAENSLPASFQDIHANNFDFIRIYNESHRIRTLQDSIYAVDKKYSNIRCWQFFYIYRSINNNIKVCCDIMFQMNPKCRIYVPIYIYICTFEAGFLREPILENILRMLEGKSR